MATEVVRSCCNMCYRLCGVLVTVKDGEPIKVEGDPDVPTNRGVLCRKGLTALERLNHPDRLLYPQKRVGKRGEGKWKRISWDEALGEIATAMNKAKATYGAESVAFAYGDPKGLEVYIWRLATVFGTPNVCDTRHNCSVPRRMAQNITCGFNKDAGTDYTADIDFSKMVVMWGVNVAFTHLPNMMQMENALSKGAKLIVVDCRRTDIAARADIWLQPRPHTDLALALGWLNVVINEELYDKEFVEKYTIGFDKLKEHIQQYSLDKVEAITWVPAEKIRAAARLYASIKPACIRGGNAMDEDINSVQSQRALTSLTALTGNLGVQGGEADFDPLPLSLEEITGPPLNRDQREMRLGFDQFIPHPAANIVVPQLLCKAILEDDPYPVKVVGFHATNPLMTWGYTDRVREAMESLEFSYLADQFMTPSAELADIVLPAATYLEADDIRVRSPFVITDHKIVQRGEAWPDKKMVNELGKKLGLGQYFWNDVNEALDFYMKPMGLTFAQLSKIHVHEDARQYHRYENEGFKTPSHKVEFYCERLKEWGHDPLPIFYEPPETPYSAPEMLKEYPYILTTWHSEVYHHSDNRQIKSIRDIEPVPIMEIHPTEAAKLGIKDGDWAYIENKRGRIKQKVKVTDGIDPRVVACSIDWWYPEQGIDTLHGYKESNQNVLCDYNPPYNPELGSTILRGFLVKVYKA
jgi:anaerobic selenocysteine-containing dehydrogenase